jgi:hypothetical protein
LRETTQSTYLALCPREIVRETLEVRDGKPNKLLFKNGSEVLFRHLDITDADIQGWIRSLNLTSFLVDQAEEISEGTFNTLVGRLSLKTEPMVQFGRLVLNPAGHDWIWQRFFNPKRKEVWHKNAGFALKTTDNAHNLTAAYLTSLTDNYPADWAERFINGSFAEFSDAVYKEFNPDIHVWDSMEWLPPKEWPVIVGMDIGGIDPWSLSFIAVEPKTGTLFLFDEMYQASILVRDIADKFNEIMEDRVLDGLAYDYENQQAALELGECGVGGAPAIKEVRPGIFKVGQYLHPSKSVPLRLFSEGKILESPGPGPRLYISNRCENHIRELGSYKWEKDRKGDLTGKPQDGNDHSCDSLRYAIHTFRPEPTAAEDPKAYENPNLDVKSRLYWHRAAIHAEQERKETARQLVRSPFSRRPSVIQDAFRRMA